MPALVDKGVVVQFSKRGCFVSLNNKKILTSSRLENDFFKLDGCSAIDFTSNNVEILKSVNAITEKEDRDKGKSHKLKSVSMKKVCQDIKGYNTIVTEKVFYERLGHLNPKDVRKLVADKMVEGVIIKGGDPATNCSACALGKMTAGKHTSHGKVLTEDIGDVIHSNICGLIMPPTIYGEKYFVTFLDVWSCYSWVETMIKKSGVGNLLIAF